MILLSKAAGNLHLKENIVEYGANWTSTISRHATQLAKISTKQ